MAMAKKTDLSDEEKARIMRNRYQREWSKKNRDRIKASQVRHYARKYDQMVEAGELDE